MRVTFQHPPVEDPFVTFNPNNKKHYPDGTGVYIYGLRLKIVEEDLKAGTHQIIKKDVPSNAFENWKFVPLYVGISHSSKKSESLKHRLWTHYIQEKSGKPKIHGRSRVAMFDFSLNQYSKMDIQSRYEDMGYYDSFLGDSDYKLDKIKKIENLIWFQNLIFFIKRHDIDPIISKLNSTHHDTIKPNGGFDNYIIKNFCEIEKQIEILRKKITDTKAKFDDHFYFVYAKFKDKDGVSISKDHISEKEEPTLWDKDGKNPDETFFNGIEHATKKALKCLKINTIADSKEKTREKIIVDLSLIKSELINLTGKTYPDEFEISYSPSNSVKV